MIANCYALLYEVMLILLKLYLNNILKGRRRSILNNKYLYVNIINTVMIMLGLISVDLNYKIIKESIKCK